MTIWWVLSAAAIAALMLYAGKGANAVWGTASLGGVIGIGIAIYYPGFDFWIIGKAVVIAALIGLAFEWLPKLFGRE